MPKTTIIPTVLTLAAALVAACNPLENIDPIDTVTDLCPERGTECPPPPPEPLPLKSQ